MSTDTTPPTIHPITPNNPPQFPCWVWIGKAWHLFANGSGIGESCTHWSGSPTRPTVVPDATPPALDFPMNKMTRQEVYEVIDGERAYQDSLGADRRRSPGPEIRLTQAEFFTLLRVYLARAEEAWTVNPGEYVAEAQANIRKIAAMCVQSMEKYGAPRR